jgi:shikimate kinase
MNVVLIGLRGTGKTSVARLLAERLGWPWFDSDERIEALAGKSIARIFAEDGEEAFRDWESRAIAELAAHDRAVLALGGGAVVREANRQAIRAAGTVVWLQASPETLWRRIQQDRATAERRPNLTTSGGITEIIATSQAREKFYRQSADHQVDTQGKTPDEVAKLIVGLVRLS